MRRQLRKLFPGARIDEKELTELLRTEILKRDVLEGDKASTAAGMVRRAGRKRERAKTAEAAHLEEPTINVEPAPLVISSSPSQA